MSIRRLAKLISQTGAVLAVSLILSACGQDSSGAYPTANQTGNPGGIIPSTGSIPSTLPDFSDAAQIALSDTTTYNGVRDMMSPDTFYPGTDGGPVGSPYISMDITATSTTAQGKFFVAVEDQKGAWAAEIPSFTGTGTRSGNTYSMIFADNIIAVRVEMNSTTGTIYYRLRASGDTACMYHSALTATQNADQCRAYMQAGSVKTFGTFVPNLSSWVK